MDNEYSEYGENPVEDMMTDYDYHVNTGELPELFDEASVDDYIANLNDWTGTNYHGRGLSIQYNGFAYDTNGS